MKFPPASYYSFSISNEVSLVTLPYLSGSLSPNCIAPKQSGETRTDAVGLKLSVAGQEAFALRSHDG